VKGDPKVASVSWQTAKAAAHEWAERNLDEDLRGKFLFLPGFADEETARFFNPKRTSEFHRMVNSAIGRIARTRGASNRYINVSIGDYRAWQGEVGITQDSQEDRAAFIAQLYKVKDSE